MSKRCPHCGNELDETARVCRQCGRLTDTLRAFMVYRQGNIGFAFLGFLFPFVGLLLYLAYRKRHPEKALMMVLGSIASSLIAILLGLLFIAAFLFSA